MTPSPAHPFVLVADDDRDTRELYRACFDTSGYRTAEAGTGSQAIAAAVEIVPDVLLTDYILPDIDGLTVAAHLKADARTAAIRILMVTGYATPDLERRAMAAGVERLFVKPALPQILMRQVARTLTRPPVRKHSRMSPAAGVLPVPAASDDDTARTRASAVVRVRDEFAALPGLALTAEQARLVFGLAADTADRVLSSLVSEGFLARTAQGLFRRPG